MADDALDSSIDWVAEHTRRYVETGGEEGHQWRGVPCLVLTTVGRKSGNLRRNALIYGVDGADHVIVASKGGAPADPLWYANLVAEPKVTVQVGAEVFDAVAETVTGADRDRLWQQMAVIWPAYEEYRAKTDRTIPVVRLRRR